MSDSEWERFPEEGALRIDGVSVDPSEVQVSETAQSQQGTRKRIEIVLPTVILRHELEEAQAISQEDDIEEFVRTDCQQNGPTAWQAYLRMLQHLVAPPSPQSGGWLRSLFARPKPSSLDRARWRIVSVDEVSKSASIIMIKGECCAVVQK